MRRFGTPWFEYRPKAPALEWIVENISHKAAPEIVVRDLRLSLIFVAVRLGVLLYIILYIIVLLHAYAGASICR